MHWCNRAVLVAPNGDIDESRSPSADEKVAIKVQLFRPIDLNCFALFDEPFYCPDAVLLLRSAPESKSRLVSKDLDELRILRI
jgi:hypothetical protein